MRLWVVAAAASVSGIAFAQEEAGSAGRRAEAAAGGPEHTEDAQSAIEQAQRLKAAGDKSGAMAAYQQAIAYDPHNAVAHNELGTLLYGAQRVSEALAEFRAATVANPSYALAYFNLGYAARKTSDCRDAVPAYQRYVQLAPTDPDGLWGLAECYRTLGQNAQAAATYEAYARLETRPSERRYQEEALSWAQQLRAPAAAPPQAAPAPAQTAAAPAPAAPPPAAPAPAAAPAPVPAASAATAAQLVARGDALMAQKQLRDALYAYQDAARADPNSIRAHGQIGLAYAMLGYYPQAIDEWNRVLQLDPSNVEARDNIQKARARLGAAQVQAAQAAPPPVADPAQAEQTAKQYYDQAVQLIQARRYSDAVTALTAAVQLRARFAVAYVARGSAYVGLGRFQDAVQDYLRGLQLNSNQAAPLFGLGEAYRGLGDRARAAQYYQECADSSAPDATDQLRTLARRRFSELLQ
ncbi:MAG: tetratricopeptide repeat protein [Myxococcales bacterium]